MFVEVTVNGIPVNALCEQWITSNNCVTGLRFGSAGEGETTRQTPTEWRVETLKRVSPTEVNLNSYSGHSVSVIAEIPLRLVQGEAHANAVVFIQKGAGTK